MRTDPGGRRSPAIRASIGTLHSTDNDATVSSNFWLWRIRPASASLSLPALCNSRTRDAPGSEPALNLRATLSARAALRFVFWLRRSQQALLHDGSRAQKFAE